MKFLYNVDMMGTGSEGIQVVNSTEHPKEFENYEITDIFFRLVEQQIYEAPEFYLWTHKRWKDKDKSPEDYDKVKV